MTPERWARIKEVLGAALEMPDGQRRAYLDEACATDAALRQEVERLLEQPSGPLPSPLAGVLAPELCPGDMLGHYRVEAKLGQGGMGAVYRAYDTSLRRAVALKVLSPEQLADPERKQRLVREARTASGLNHPNIVTIHEIGSEGGADFIAMEYVEGQSLERLIPPKGLPLDKSLDYGMQIAGALAKAHGAGIIHRDLKPGNIMVTGDGLVKLVDFGLAGRVHVAAGETGTLTIEGEVFGTPAYMSPEQAEGKTADERTDIFSFGAVLYEMLSGRRAFQGNSTAAVLGAVLKEEPPPLANVPAELEKLVARCLRKDPARRLQHMDDVRLLLEEIRETAEKPPPAPERRRRSFRLAALALIVASACVALGLVFWQRKPRAAEMKLVPLTSYPGLETQPSFSPDGSQIAFAWDGENQDNYDIYVTVVGSATAPLRLTRDPAPDLYPAWSPDGRRIAFMRQGGLYLISALGGPERKLVDIQFPSVLALYTEILGWSPDGKWLAVSEGPWEGPWAISLISVAQGDRRTLLSGFSVPRVPEFSPDGRYLAYASCLSFGGTCDVYLLELDRNLSPRGPSRRLTQQRLHIEGLAWTPDSLAVVYAAASCPTGPFSLWRAGISGAGAPERIDVAGLGAECPAISRAGTRLAYVRRSGDTDLWKFRVGSAAPVKFISSSLNETNPDFSPDGNRIAFVSNRSGGCPEIWVSDRDGSNTLPLTNEERVYKGSPRWSPDGRWIAFDRYAEDGHPDIWVMDNSGGQLRRLTTFSTDESVPNWSRDGKWIYFRSNRSGRSEIWRMPFQGGQAVQMTDNGGYVGAESWDGRTLYYLKTASNLGGSLFARSLAGGPELLIIPDTIGNRAFYPVENGIYYVEMPENPAAPHNLKYHNLAMRRAQVLTAIDGRQGQGLTVSPDQTTVLFTGGRKFGADLMLIENFK